MAPPNHRCYPPPRRSPCCRRSTRFGNRSACVSPANEAELPSREAVPMTGDNFDLQRFVDAQDSADTFAAALTELRRGRKSSHWLWFVFPQTAALGGGPVPRHYAISSIAEAVAYLEHP